MTHLHAYETWGDFLDAAKATTDAWQNGKTTSRETDDRGWSGAETWQEAVSLARQGWPEGCQKLVDGLRATPQTHTVRAVTYDVAGMYPCVPTYLAGDPACMIDLGDQTIASRPIVRLRVDLAANAYVPAEAIFAHGIAVVSLVDAMEHAGYSCEVAITRRTRTMNNEGKIVMQLDVPFKLAGQPWDLDRAAFALANASVSRRFYFALLESHEDLAYLGAQGHGKATKAEPKDGYITMPQADEDITDPEQAAARLRKHLANNGITFNCT